MQLTIENLNLLYLKRLSFCKTSIEKIKCSWSEESIGTYNKSLRPLKGLGYLNYVWG